MATKTTQAATQDAAEFVISRVFDAPRALVWKAFTESEHLKHWWGPKGFTVTAAKVELRPGGIFHYGLRSANGQEMWGKWIYREIVAPKLLVCVVSFADEGGNPVRHPFAADWPMETLSTMTFTEQNGKTTVTIRWSPLHATAAECKAFDAGRDGMKHGFTGTFDQLAAYLAKV